eukprot:SAG22_NODE_8072_length_686_cov_0.781942_1_plen_117_part_10
MSQLQLQKRLAEGWTLLESEVCPQCESPLAKDATEEHSTWCVYCNLRVMTESDLMAELESTRKMASAVSRKPTPYPTHTEHPPFPWRVQPDGAPAARSAPCPLPVLFVCVQVHAAEK